MSKTADSGIDEQQRQANEGIYDLVKGANGNSYWTKPPDSGVKESLTKREYFAAMCLQGILANESQVLCETKAEKAVRYADGLIEALNKG